jgi:hypothetical protein
MIQQEKNKDFPGFLWTVSVLPLSEVKHSSASYIHTQAAVEQLSTPALILLPDH